MKHLFSSPNPDLQKSFREIIEFSLDQILTEQRAQRGDLATLNRKINKFINEWKLQTEVDDYYDSGDKHESEIGSGDTVRQPEVVQTSDSEVS